MIEELLPSVAAAAATTGDLPDADLHPEELALVRRMVPSRRQEFATGRHCARQALGLLGVPPGPIARTEGGAPRWPDGTVGSMTHCAGYRAAAVARRRDLLALGIDAEPHAALPGDVRQAITLGSERVALADLAAAHPRIHWDRLLFSAKESVYKAWHPLTGRWLDFTDAVLAFDPVHNTFTARLLVTPCTPAERRFPLEFSGRWAVRAGLALTAVAIPAPTAGGGTRPVRGDANRPDEQSGR
ncbi:MULTISPECIES: 4'-phosphopantetheinyl transferase superfamily protein [unclassified Streptomyces]|uniref:4'-phosphopantetheinyl transferase family protein n=1 Tax=unclassified Streptomyces TaxID=2593676 RepID=UPI002E290BC3|nr:4'-phosphopantetheinyl transferase superfamily protein [Streptomyces sp. NBC_00272]